MSSETASHDRKERAWVAETVRKIQQGSVASAPLRGDAVEAHFELLFREYEPRIRSKLRYRGWRGAELDDVVQDVMIRVYRGLETFRFDSSFDTWILLIMSNAARNAARDRSTGKARATRASLDSLLASDGESGPAIAEPAAAGDGPLEGALADERKARLAAALDQLPARIRQCLLFRYQGYKYREIADAQGVTVATVKKQVSQGHKRLRPILGSFVELFGVFLVSVLLWWRSFG